jgi:hypothetical protein
VADEFTHLYGQSLVAFAQQETGTVGWGRFGVFADGSLYFQPQAFVSLPPAPGPGSVFLAVLSAIREGKVRLLADGDDTLGFTEAFVPLGLLRGDWCVYADKGRDPLHATDPWGTQVGPIYFRPRFAPPEQSVAAGKTGTAGRPSSWHLVEAECRRRYGQGERHTGIAGESPTGWADVLLPWLHEEHPNQPPLKPKTAKNNLTTLLRKLKKAEPEIGA